MGLKTNFIIQLLKNGKVNLFQTSLSYSFDHCRQFALSFISFSHVCTATLSLCVFRVSERGDSKANYSHIHPHT